MRSQNHLASAYLGGFSPPFPSTRGSIPGGSPIVSLTPASVSTWLEPSDDCRRPASARSSSEIVSSWTLYIGPAKLCACP